MKKSIQKLLLLLFSSFIVSIAVLLTVYAGFGTSSWDLLHLGIVHHTPLSLGMVSQCVGFIMLCVAILLKVYPGVATFLNILLIGFLIDFIDRFQLISSPKNIILRFAMLCVGIIFLGFGSYFYTVVGWGAGPRDSLMLALIKATKKPVWIIRTSIEFVVVLIGILLGENLKFGTFLISFSVGPIIQLATYIFKVNLGEVTQENLLTHVRAIKSFSNKTLDLNQKSA